MSADPFAPLGAETNSRSSTGPGRPDWVPVLPAPLPLPNTIRHRRNGTPSRVWHYRDADGTLLFAVCRFDPPGAPKEVLPYSCGAGGWRWKSPPTPRPLYGLDRLATRPDAPVIVCEGEKCADYAAALFPDAVAVTWPGGAEATGKADWSPLRGRLAAAWPDNDAPGRKAAEAVRCAALAAGAAHAAVIDVPTDWPDGWDVADPLPKGVTAATLLDMVAQATTKRPESPGEALRADVERAAAMSRVDYLTARLNMAKRHRIPVAELDALRAEHLRDEAAASAAERDDPYDPYASADGPADPRGRADLFVDTTDMPDTAADLAKRLAALPHLFDRGGPARLARDRTRNAAVVEALTVNGVVNEAHAIARPWLYRPKGENLERQNVTLPERVARLYLDNRSGWNLRPLDGITSAPLLHEDGGVRHADGYDATTRLWCENVPTLDVPAAPSRTDAEAALLRLRQHFRTFAFADAERVEDHGLPVPVVDISTPPGADESAFLVALMTATCRPCLWLAPAFLARAPEYSGAGTGKGLLVRAICAIAFGVRPVAMTAGASPEELDKRLTAALMEAGPTLFLDNVNAQALKSDVLASAITERPASVRVLGRSTIVQLNPTAFVCVTGNGIALSEDLARRFVTVELDAGVEDPETRDFRTDFIAETFAAREAMLRDVLIIWRWGRLQGDELPAGRALGSFTAWGRWCRDPLVALGCRDPALRVASAKAKDPRRQAVAEIFAAWWEAHQDRPVTVATLAESVRQVADPASRSRQYLAARIRALDCTRAGGFVLTRTASVGKWSADTFTLQRSTPEHHRGHRDHKHDEPRGWSEDL